MRPIRTSRLAATGVVIAACLSVPTQSQGSLVAAASTGNDDAPAAAPEPITVPELPAAPLVEERTAATVRRPVLSRTPSGDAEQVPDVALAAYQRAAAVIAEVDGDCGLTWTLLAAIGSIESDHGRYGGAVLDDQGVSDPAILGPVLDGRGAVAAVPDTDGGLVDGNTRWDRAVGPMQILPSTWATVGVDADGDGQRSADDIDDAALGAAVYLCGAPGDLGSKAGLREALLRYNPSAAYADAVTALERAYRDGSAALLGIGDTVVVEAAGPLLPVVVDADAPGGEDAEAESQGIGRASHAAVSVPKHPSTPSKGGKDGKSGHDGKPTKPGGGNATPSQPGQPAASPTVPADPSPRPGSGPSADPTTDPTTDPSTDPTTDPTTDPSTDPTTDPSPEPSTQVLTGTLTDCGTEAEPAWCVGEIRIDVGDAGLLAAVALADFDGDGAVETNAEELAGLVGTAVTVTTSVPGEGARPVLLRIGERGYRDAAVSASGAAG